MIDITQLFGQPAVSLATSERTGTVQGFRFEGNRIVSVDIGDGRTVPAQAVKSFDGDALTYDHDAAETPTGQTNDNDDGPDTRHSAVESGMLAGELRLPVAAVASSWANPIGTVLLSETGDALGTLTAMRIDADGAVADVGDDSGRTHIGDRVLTVGSFATIITLDDTRTRR